MQPQHEGPVHAISADVALARFGTNSAGLSSDEAARRLQHHGPNCLPVIAGASLFSIAVHQFQSPFIYLLLAAAALSLAIGQLAEGIFILSVLVVNAMIGGWQEWRAELRTQGLKALVRGRLPVWRSGRLVSVDIEHLVPGDIVQVESGIRVPADLRLIEAQTLTADESLLTGESLPVEKWPDRAVAAEAVLSERTNMLFSGASVHRGRGRGLVVATGWQSEIGRLAKTLRTPAPPAPLLRRMEDFSRQLGIVIVILILFIGVVEFARGSDMADIVLIAIALAVSAIPEALPVATTVVLSISVHRMGLRQVVVRHLPAVEGLGSCTVIATDKTGTLTLNLLSIGTVWLPASEAGPAVQLAPTDSRARGLSFAAARCSESHGSVADHLGEEIGDAVDLAFLRLAAAANYDAVMEAISHRGRIAYEPERRYAADFHTDGGVLMAYVKGAPETVLALCGTDQWSDAQRQETDQAIQSLARAGNRVIAVAAGPVETPGQDALKNLTLLGFAGLIDPLRPEAKAAVEAARGAGVRVIMVTGDHPATAQAIARELGILHGTDDGAIITGAQLRVLEGNPAAFDLAVSSAVVFARTEPLQKLAIVQSLQRQGHIVAVTGDGINDVAALHAADIGVAMGRAGTDAARDAADLILVDDNFASIVAGIEEGRAAYANLRKVVLHCVSTSMSGLALMLLSTLAGLPLPLTALQLLWLNLVSNGIQDVSLGFEKPEAGILNKPPRHAGSSIFDRAMIEQVILSGGTIGVLSFAVYVYLLHGLGFGLIAAQGAMLWLLLWFENAHVLNCRSETRSLFGIPLSSNWLLIGGVTVTQFLQVLAANLPVMGTILRLESLTLAQGLLLALPALLLTGIMEGYKAVRVNRGPEYAAFS